MITKEELLKAAEDLFQKRNAVKEAEARFNDLYSKIQGGSTSQVFLSHDIGSDDGELSVAKRIEAYLKAKHGHAAKSAELTSAFANVKPKTVYATLSWLNKKNRISATGRGEWVLLDTDGRVVHE